MIALANVGLLPLAAGVLAVPIAIHLWSRRPARLVSVGSTRLLAGAKPSQARRLALTDLPLLALRLAVLAAAGLGVAGLGWRGAAASGDRIALIAPTVNDAMRLADSLRTVGWSVRWLQAGLPLTTAPRGEAAPLWSVLRDATTLLPTADSVLVQAPLTAASLDGMRPTVPFHLRLEPTAAPATSPAAERLVLCLADLPSPRVQQRLAAALEAIGTASARPAELRASPCTTSGAPVLLTRPSPSEPIVAQSGVLGRSRTRAVWLADSAALESVRIIDALSSLLAVRAVEATRLPVGIGAAQPHATASLARTSLTAWQTPLALAALLLLALERVAAYTRSTRARAPGSADD